MTSSHTVQNASIGEYAMRVVQSVLSIGGYELARADKVLRTATTKTFTQNYARPIETIFDIGANIGQSVERFHRLFPKASITCFEPVKANFEQLSRVVAKIPRARVLRQALGAEPGQGTIYVPTQTFLSTLMPVGEGQPSEVVGIDTLDRVRAQLAVEFIDIMKIDVEGFELKVIEGAAETLRAGKVGMVYIEAGLRDDNTCHTHFGELYAALKPYGFSSFGLYDITRWGESLFPRGPFKNTLFGNALFIHESQLRGV